MRIRRVLLLPTTLRCADVLTAELVDAAFGVRARVIEDPDSATPLIIPVFRPAQDAAVSRLWPP